ncbi:hypothetical protein MPTK1_5g00500 [Marchantia polymorpha subsp. ruderalis]|uniref:Uncharacterized protein n=2 Tax=Marchantia polymorpha TaxID=3197 RepID=A0AAF6BDH0_MARPO|nr:hypothetical protein MARPO_0078s0049 [Marchantia polymorpha]BBN10054.1 hypothetical protein Mp_5g00500 [Marchantia polymorpha subsp. ruderalis]|eukprot:PTQ34647.1 hypothetical protein MARPO_0078s0049 [Marchantia polymorpha]
MGLYSASPKKSSAGYGSQRWSEVRRRIVHRRYLCLWVLLALVPCYMLRQMFSSSSPRLSTATTRPTEGGSMVTEKMVSEKPMDDSFEAEEEKYEKAERAASMAEDDTIPLPRAVNVFREEVKAEKVEKEEKVEKVEKKAEKHEKKKSKKNSTSKMLSDHSLAKYDGDFGVPEDNDKEEEQLWQAPPSPIKKPTNVEESRR